MLFGLFGFAGQLISSINFELAQKLGLQESEQVEPLFSRLEKNTALWDIFVYWIVVVAGVLMIFDHSWWPYLTLVGGGVYLDTGGRELVKWDALNKSGIKTGRPKDRRVAMWFLGFTSLLGAGLILLALKEVLT